jgi:hypothetical protein
VALSLVSLPALTVVTLTRMPPSSLLPPDQNLAKNYQDKPTSQA